MSWLLVSAATTTMIAIAHSFLGERLILPRLLRSEDLPSLRHGVDFTRSILRWAWHLTSLAWLALAVQLVLLGDLPLAARQPIGTVIAVCLGLSGLIAFATTKGRHVAWPLFLIATVAAWLGSH